MPLPDIVTPTYELVIPSSKKKLKYRPFLVKEQKVLILALEENDSVQILEAIKTIFKSCIITRFKMDDLSIFDVEYIFLQLRGRSIQETIDVEVPCDDDEEVKVPVSFPVDAVKVNFPEGHESTIKLTEDIYSLKFIKTFSKLIFPKAEALVCSCLCCLTIPTPGQTHSLIKISTLIGPDRVSAMNSESPFPSIYMQFLKLPAFTFIDTFLFFIE